jgi:DNA (cytosine-5)-methyltransferase 1
MKYLSTFSGVGGFELGIQQAYERLCNANGGEVGGGKTDKTYYKGQGLFSKERKEVGTKERPTRERNNNISYERPLCIGFSEIDKYATKVYQHHFPTHKAYGDITKIDEKTLPDFDLLVGGFPCQSFSIAGKRGGFNDTRGTLFFDIARIVREKQPRLLLLENVKGLLSHDQGRTFFTIISTLDELGYDCQWQVLNAKDFGVPQNRERVFIVANLRGTPRPEVFPIGDDCQTPDELSGQHSNTLTARYYGGQENGTYVIESELNAQGDIKQLNNPTHSNDRVYGTDGVSPTLNTMQGGRRQPFVVAERGRYKDDGTIEQKLESRHDGLTNTLTSVEKDNRVFDGQIRRLTPLECERLMGLPDGWTNVEGMSDSQRYKQCGNGVVVNVVQAIMERLL